MDEKKFVTMVGAVTKCLKVDPSPRLLLLVSLGLFAVFFWLAMFSVTVASTMREVGDGWRYLQDHPRVRYAPTRGLSVETPGVLCR